MKEFGKAIFEIIEKSHELSLGDRLLVNGVIAQFSTDWEQRVGRPPTSWWIDIAMIAPAIRELGFSMIDVDRWEQEEIQPFLKAKKSKR